MNVITMATTSLTQGLYGGGGDDDDNDDDEEHDEQIKITVWLVSFSEAP